MRTSRDWLLAAATIVLVACSDRAPTEAAVQLEFDTLVGDPTNGTGWIFGRGGVPEFVHFEVDEGLAVFQGDIILGPVSSIARTRQQLLAARLVSSDAVPGWPNGVVPYTISSAFTAAQRDSIIKGIQMIDSKVPGLSFRAKASGDRNWIRFVVSANKCQSWLGRRPSAGEQWIELEAVRCAQSPGIVAHEVIHALGAWHEHARCDRDQYVIYDSTNVDPEKRDQFKKQCGQTTYRSPYTEESVMHYAAYHFTVNPAGPPALTSLRGRPMGQRDSLATNDWLSLREMYGVTIWPALLELAEVGGYPFLTFTEPSGIERYDLHVVSVWEEWDDYSGTFTTFEGATSQAGGFISASQVHDTYNAYTGNSRCTVWSSINGSGGWVYYYEITPVYLGGTLGTPWRQEAPVAPC